MKINMKLANYLAAHSISDCEKNRYVRKACRTGYRFLMKLSMFDKEHVEAVHVNKSELYLRKNSYPPLFADKRFASWQFDCETDGNLITDPSNFVIRYPTSYCNYKIWEATGEWLRRPKSEQLYQVMTGYHLPERGRFDARHWIGLLRFNGYWEDSGLNYPLNGHHYVGLIPDVGEWGMLFWYEYGKRNEIFVSTYENFNYVLRPLTQEEMREVKWVEIKLKRVIY